MPLIIYKNLSGSVINYSSLLNNGTYESLSLNYSKYLINDY